MTICSSCGREFQASSDGEALCPQCAAEYVLRPGPCEARPSRLRLYLQSPTIVLIALNTLVYLMMAFQGHSFLTFDSELLLNWGANSGALTAAANGGACLPPPLSTAGCCTSR